MQLSITPWKYSCSLLRNLVQTDVSLSASAVSSCEAQPSGLAESPLCLTASQAKHPAHHFFQELENVTLPLVSAGSSLGLFYPWCDEL